MEGVCTFASRLQGQGQRVFVACLLRPVGLAGALGPWGSSRWGLGSSSSVCWRGLSVALEGSMLRTLLICGLPAAAAAAPLTPRTPSDPPPTPICASKLDQYCGNESNPELKICYASMKMAKRKPKIPLVAAFSGKPGVSAAWRCYSCAPQPHRPPTLLPHGRSACCKADRPGRPGPRRHAAAPAQIQRHLQSPRLLLQLHSPDQDLARM